MVALRRTALVVTICLGIPLATALPASAARSLTVTPSTDLVEAQTVSVTGAGFTPVRRHRVLSGNHERDTKPERLRHSCRHHNFVNLG